MTAERHDRSGWQDVREPITGTLLFRYDPARDLVEVKHGQLKAIVDLAEYKRRAEVSPN
ncbi:MAG: hypothetical protein GX597_05360 [Anaerolineaceae bacterium]|nr:hypothetical protein [Anaerolineaceae bacterium]